MDSRTTVLISAAVMVPCCWIFMLARGYIRVWMLRNAGWEDLVLMLALLVFTAMSALQFDSLKYGMGEYMADIDPAKVPRGLKEMFFTQLLWCFCTTLIKISIAMLQIRVLAGSNYPIHRRILKGLIGLNIVTSIYWESICIFHCSPVSYAWDHGQSGTCIEPRFFGISAVMCGSIHTASDVVLTLLPMHLIWNLKIAFKLRMVVCAILGLALLASIATIVRFPLYDFEAATEPLYYIGPINGWFIVETGLGICFACVVTLRPLWMLATEKMGALSSVFKSRGSSSRASWQKMGGSESSKSFNSHSPGTVTSLQSIVPHEVESHLGQGRGSIGIGMTGGIWKTSEINVETVDVSKSIEEVGTVNMR